MRAEQRVQTPFEHRVPRELRANLKWRAAVHRKVLADPGFAEVIREACAKDFLFWMAGFLWTYDPRQKPFPKLPFIPYQFQEEAALEIIFAMGVNDLLIEKSRDMGVSWLLVAIYTWFWLYQVDQSFLFVSRVEEYVDSGGNPKALFWKVDYILDNLPVWMQPQGYKKSEHRRKMHIENPETGSVIDGESTTGNVARGDRRTAELFDEFAVVDQGHRVLASSRDSTNCRMLNSTPFGINNAFYDIRQTNIQKLTLHWTVHPRKSIGLYRKEGDRFVIVDEEYWSGIEDPISEMQKLDKMILDRGVPLPNDKLRSPWYAGECDRAASAQEIAQELDIDYLGSGFQYFNQDAIREAIRRYARPPVLVGDLEYDEATAEPIAFREDPKGKLRLWFLLDRDGNPPLEHRKTLGADVSAGTGASNSCLSAWDSVTTEKVVEYANPYIRPEAFAKQAVALARWLGKAFLLWESNGPGRQFGSRVMELGYGNVYMSHREEALSKKVSDIPGWSSTKEKKLVLMGAYRASVENGDCVNRSKEALNEALEYIFDPRGGVVHARANDKTDPSGANTNHGDRVIADALGVRGFSERVHRPNFQAPVILPGCLAWRNKMREATKPVQGRELSAAWR